MLGRGPWVGLMEHPERDFCLNRILKISDRKGFERPSLLIFYVELVPLTSSSTIGPPVEKKKKKTIEIAIKVATLASEPLFVFVASVSSSSASSAQTSEGNSGFSRLDPSDPEICHSEPEPEPIALRVINESEVNEKDMSNDMRTGFKERHHKCLYERIDMVPLPVRRACRREFLEEPGREVPPMPMPLSDVVGSSSMPAAKKKLVRKKLV